VRVLFVTHYFPPEELSAAFLAFEFAHALVDAGHQADVLTGFPNWPSGRAFAGYDGSAFCQEDLSGIHVYRLPFRPSPNGNFLQRALDFKSFEILAWRHGRKLARPDLVYALAPPNEDALVARRLAMHFRCAYVPNIQDIQPDTAIALGYLKNPLVISFLRRQENAMYRGADCVVAIGDAMKRRLIEKGIPAGLIEVLPNWINPLDVVPLSRKNALRSEWQIPDDRFVVLYAGTFGRIHGVPIMLTVAEKLRDTRALILLVGQGHDFGSLEAEARSGRLPNLQVRPFVPRSRLSEMQALSDISVVLVKRGYGHTSMPSKVLGYMSAGRPVFGSLELDCDTSAVIREADCGVLIPPDQPQVLAESIRTAMDERDQLARWGSNARRFVEDKLSAEVVLRRGVALLERIVAGRRQ
jgi:colanic acid biosynthesis glycosyl transferase WcaI